MEMTQMIQSRKSKNLYQREGNVSLKSSSTGHEFKACNCASVPQPRVHSDKKGVVKNC